MDKFGITYGVLQSPGMYIGIINQVDVAVGLARAWNDWMVAEYLDRDPRLLGSLSITLQDVPAALREIDRLGPHPQMVQVLVCSQGPYAFGHRTYHPVYEACQRHNLVFGLHPGREGAQTSSFPVGRPSCYFEWHTSLPLTYQGHAISLLGSGVFEKYPGFRVMLTEGGFGWLPSLLWRMDKNWKALRNTVPWLRQPPSAYAFEHIRLTTQPMEEPPDPRQLAALFEMIQAERTLCFSSDFPHWDFDDPRNFLPASIPEETREAIFHRTAADLFGLTLPRPTPASAS
jgi:predicted TIM-barrel fold metal-dependent hydrolase